MQVLVVLPTYNEQANIERMLHAVRASVPEADIVVVDDSSPDGTADIARRVAEDLGQIEVYVRPEKNGLGPAYRAGFAWGLERGYEAFVEMDCDFSHDPAELPLLVKAAEDGADLVIGSRYVPGGSIPSWSLSRKLLSRGGNVYAKWMLGLHVEDSTAGFRVYSAELLRRIGLESVRADGYGFQIEMTYRARRCGADVREVPIRFIDRVAGTSKMSMSTVTEALALVTMWGLQRLVGRGPKLSAVSAESANARQL